jgi:hypothetical protein
MTFIRVIVVSSDEVSSSVAMGTGGVRHIRMISPMRFPASYGVVPGE